MQKAFKQMRRARIMTGEYTFPHGVSSRLERAREGMDVVLFFQGLSRFDLFWLCCDKEWVTNRMVSNVDISLIGGHSMSQTMTPRGTSGAPTSTAQRYSFLNDYLDAIEKGEKIKPHATIFEGEPAYSDCKVAVDQGMLYFSDNLSLVKFCVGNLPGKEHSQLNKAEHSYFVNAGTISCVIINAEHYNAAADGGTVATVKTVSPVPVAASADTSSGHWVTICGPKVGFGRKIADVYDANGKKFIRRPVGLSVENSHKLAAEYGTVTNGTVGTVDEKGRCTMSCDFLEISMTGQGEHQGPLSA
jgi:hypothetical protein